jgi:hypothetical protein
MSCGISNGGRHADCWLVGSGATVSLDLPVRCAVRLDRRSFRTLVYENFPGCSSNGHWIGSIRQPTFAFCQSWDGNTVPRVSRHVSFRDEARSSKKG